MNPKIQKISNEIEKIKVKISEFQSKLKELEKQKAELENADIIDAVRSADISIADLAAILKEQRATSGQIDPKSADIDTNKEENE